MTMASYFVKCAAPSSRAVCGRCVPCFSDHAVHRGFEAFESFRETARIVRFADEPRFARIRLAQDAEIVQLRRERFVERVIAARPVPVVARRLLAEEQATHRGMAAERMLDPTLGENLA